MQTNNNEVVIDLPKEALEWLKRELQWPEDLAAYDKLNAPTNLTELNQFFA